MELGAGALFHDEPPRRAKPSADLPQHHSPRRRAPSAPRPDRAQGRTSHGRSMAVRSYAKYDRLATRREGEEVPDPSSIPHTLRCRRRCCPEARLRELWASSAFRWQARQRLSRFDSRLFRGSPSTWCTSSGRPCSRSSRSLTPQCRQRWASRLSTRRRSRWSRRTALAPVAPVAARLRRNSASCSSQRDVCV
jgi:hypothetical protein